MGLLSGPPDAYRTGPRLIPISEEAMHGLRDLWTVDLDNYAAVAVEYAQRLQQEVADLPVGEQHPWPDLCHMVVAGQLLDLAVGALLAEERTVTSKPTGETVVWAFAPIGAENSFGIQQWTGQRHRAMLAQLWHREVPSRQTRLSEAMVDHLADLASGDEAPRGANEAPDAESRRQDLYLRHQGLLRRGEDGPALRVPVFGLAETRKLAPILRDGAHALVHRGIDPALGRLGDHPWWKHRVGDDAHRHAAIRLLLEFGIDRSLQAGALSPFSEQLENAAVWGRCLWYESSDQSWSLIPGWQDRDSSSSKPQADESPTRVA